MTTKLAELWLSYALDDLQSARVLLNEKIFNMVCFHSQQAVEKLFKAFIAIHHQEIPSLPACRQTGFGFAADALRTVRVSCFGFVAF